VARELTGARSLLARATRALYYQGDLRAGRERFEAAFHAARWKGDAEAMALAALGLGGLWVHERRTVADAALVEARQSAALARLDPLSPLGLRLRIRLTAERDYREGRHSEIMAALAEARQAGDPLAIADALSLAHQCVLGPEHGAVRRALAVELVRASGRTHRRTDLLMGLLWQAVDLLLDADPHAERRLAQVRGLLERDGHLAVAYVLDAIDVMRSIRAGRFAEAEALAAACAERGAVAGHADTDAWHGAHLVAVRWYQGRLAELVPMLADLAHSPTLSAVDSSLFGALAVAAATAGDRRAAAGALARLAGSDLGDLPRSSTWLVAMYGAVEAAHLLDEPAVAARAYELLRPFARLPMMASLGVACFGSTEHALGVAALTTGRADRAVEHLRAAVRDNLALGHWPAVVLSRSRLAEAYALQGAVGSARTESAAAAEEAAALGMPVQVGTGEAPGPVVECRRAGRRWEVRLGRRRVTVEHSVGMRHLATLLAHPRRAIPAVDLAAGCGGTPLSAQPVLDDVARHGYRERLRILVADIEALEAVGDAERAARYRAERDWLLAELSAASGLNGRVRRFTDDDERARIAVGKAIRRAVSRIVEVDPVIGDALRTSVSTGNRCSYTPS